MPDIYFLEEFFFKCYFGYEFQVTTKAVQTLLGAFPAESKGSSVSLVELYYSFSKKYKVLENLSE